MVRSRFSAVALVAALAIPLSSLAEACVPPNTAVELMLDASYSMLKNIGGGVTRFNAARMAAEAVVELFPDDGLLALRFYGSQSQVVRNDCTDTVLAVPFGRAADNREQVKTALAGAHAHGVTPIALALQAAAQDFTSDAIRRTIVLVSDGGESCNGDPCAVAATMAAEGFVINTVGLMTTGLDRAELRCIAAAGNGQYFDVPVAVRLPDTLMQALGQCPVAWLAPSRSEDGVRMG